MAFLQKKNTSPLSELDAIQDGEIIDNFSASEAETMFPGHKPDPHAKKGHATPSRKQASGKRPAPVGPPPMTRAEARQRKKSLGPSSREEKKAASTARREANAQRRARMMAGDDAVLPAKDRGPIRHYARSAIDSRRSVSNYLLPILFISLVISLGFSKQPQYMVYGNFIFMALLFLLLVDAAIASWLMIKKTRRQFPRERINAKSLFFYGFLRSIQLRKLRMPAPSTSNTSHAQKWSKTSQKNK